MNRKEIEKAFRYFTDETKAAADGTTFKFSGRAMEACARKLDEMDRKERERLKAIAYFAEEIKRLERAPEENNCTMTEEWAERIRMCEIAIALLEEEENE